MQNIEIRTTQNVSIQYELALLWDRIGAFLIDLMIFGGFFLFFIIIISAFGSSLSEYILYIIYVVFSLIGFLSYHFLFELFNHGQTWGKKAVGLKVVRLDGKEPGLWDYGLRAAFNIVDSIASMGILAAIFISTSQKKQRLGDIAANTTVVRLKPRLKFNLHDILKINSIQDYEPIYPQIRKMSEQDMLLIKRTISRYNLYKNDAHIIAVNELVNRLTEILELQEPPKDKIVFLKTLIKDYIVLTR